ncbi:uncharacterized protein K452DRAFT_283654 [Aplosporella prunicola CBS 121167]|uniref:Uncharacterized protein n=1 Tax=Aplosporella prunicola CBS 121167 TaxID=1176127 RepID=A0A6A6BQM1_9PEZI|nr:uncharacterized protein K452DRAFT_283654 [Aplosporella prunicola CBS 121167]KAF2146386.1 hypothetical protein K452DRAFT_283654 [Aplosporella prunicola CBS 121167]
MATTATAAAAAATAPSLLARHLARPILRPHPPSLRTATTATPAFPRRRHLQTASSAPQQPTPKPTFGFAFDIDGVLLRSSTPLPRASATLRYLRTQSIPFILLTNGGGTHESARVAELSDKLGVPIHLDQFVQSHTPFARMDAYKDKTVLVVGGDGDSCRGVAEMYGYKHVVTPADVWASDPSLWPFSKHWAGYYEQFARPLPPGKLKVDAIFVYADPRDWGLDTALIVDLLLSRNGEWQTLSPLNKEGNFQADGQPPLFFSNPDLWWAAKHALPRLGQGGFRAALEGVWEHVTRGACGTAVPLQRKVFGKPGRETYKFAEERLGEMLAARAKSTQSTQSEGAEVGVEPLKRVYMVGDNPESDIRGANDYASPLGTDWFSVLVQSGVYREGETPSCVPRECVKGVGEAVELALGREGWGGKGGF